MNNENKIEIEKLLGLPLELAAQRLVEEGYNVSVTETKPPRVEKLTGEKRVISIKFLKQKDAYIIYSIFNTEPKRND